MTYVLSKEELKEIKEKIDNGLTVQFNEDISDAQYFSIVRQIKNYIYGE